MRVGKVYVSKLMKKFCPDMKLCPPSSDSFMNCHFQ